MLLIQPLDSRQRFVLIAAAITVVLATSSMLLIPNPAWTLFLFAAPAIFIVMMRLPGVVFAAYLYVPFYKSVLDPYLPIDLTVVLAAACVLLAMPMFYELRQRFPTNVLLIWSLLLALVSVGVMYSSDWRLAGTQLIYYTGLVFFPLTLGVRVARNRQLLDQFIVATVVLAVAVTTSGLAQLAGSGFHGRIAAMSNTIGTARSAFLLPIVLPAILRIGPRWLALLSVMVAPFAFLVAVASGSRGPLVMAIITIAVMQLLNSDRVGRKLVVGGLTLGTLIMLLQIPQIQMYIPQQSISRIQAMFDSVLREGDFSSISPSRTRLFGTAAEMVTERPLFGYGTAGFESVMSSLPGMEQFAYPHNLVLQIAAEFGIIGVALVSCFVISAILRGASLLGEPRIQAVFGLALFALLNAMVSSSFYDNRWLWGMLLLVLALPRRDNERSYHQLPAEGAQYTRRGSSL